MVQESQVEELPMSMQAMVQESQVEGQSILEDKGLTDEYAWANR